MNTNKNRRMGAVAAATAAAALVAGGLLTAGPAQAGVPTYTLRANLGLHAGQALESPGLQYDLVMQSDGNLVESNNGHALWSSRTGGNPGAYLKFQTDNNAVIYSRAGKALWSTQTGVDATTNGEIGLAGDGEIYVKNQAGQVVWENGAPGSNTLTVVGSRSFLIPGWYLHAGVSKLVMQGDGNLVLSRGGKAIWSTATGGHPGAQLVLQNDGNLVVYASDGRTPLWNARTRGTGAHNQLVLGADGSLALKAGTRTVWTA